MSYSLNSAIHLVINWGLNPFRLKEHKLGFERERASFSTANSIPYDMLTLFRGGDAIDLLQFFNLRPSIHPFNKSNICRFPLMTSNSCFQILFRNVQRPKTFPIFFVVVVFKPLYIFE